MKLASCEECHLKGTLETKQTGFLPVLGGKVSGKQRNSIQFSATEGSV